MRPLWVFWVSGHFCQPKAFQFNNLEVTHSAFKLLKSLRVCFSSWLYFGAVFFYPDEFSQFQKPSSEPTCEFVTSLRCFYVKRTDSSGAQSVPVFSNQGRKIHKHSPKSALQQLRPPHTFLPTLFQLRTTVT